MKQYRMVLLLSDGRKIYLFTSKPPHSKIQIGSEDELKAEWDHWLHDAACPTKPFMIARRSHFETGGHDHVRIVNFELEDASKPLDPGVISPGKG